MTTPGADRFTYFNGNPVKTLPDASRASVGTDRLGLFAGELEGFAQEIIATLAREGRL